MNGGQQKQNVGKAWRMEEEIWVVLLLFFFYDDAEMTAWAE